MAISAVSSPEEIANLALDAIGYPQSIGDLFEGTKAARVALRYYAQTRDSVLRAKDWDFAERQVPLALNGQTAPPPWLFEYAFPDDCLRVRNIYVRPAGSFPVLDPRPQLFTVFNDSLALNPPQQVILANINPANMTYTGQVLDPQQWNANFIEMFVKKLASLFAMALRDSPQLVPLAQKLAELAEDVAISAQSNVPPSPVMARPTERGGQ